MRDPVNWKRTKVILDGGLDEGKSRERRVPARGTGTEQNTCADSMRKLTCHSEETIARRMIDVDGRERSRGRHLCMLGTKTRISCWGRVTLADASAQPVVAAGVVVRNGCVFACGESQQNAIVRPSRRREPAARSAGLGEGHADQQQHCWRDRLCKRCNV